MAVHALLSKEFKDIGSALVYNFLMKEVKTAVRILDTFIICTTIIPTCITLHIAQMLKLTIAHFRVVREVLIADGCGGNIKNSSNSTKDFSALGLIQRVKSFRILFTIVN